MEDLLGQEYIPLDGDPELEILAGIFCAPSREQLETGDLADFYHPQNGALSSTFDWLWEISEVDDTAVSAKNENLKPVLIDVIWRIKFNTKAGERLRLLHRGSIPFEIPQLNFWGKTEGDGILIGYNEDYKSLSIPLAILSVVKESGISGMAKYEVPQALLPAIMAYSRNPNLKEYHGFAICYDGKSMYVVRATISSSYRESFCTQKATSEDLLLYRSKRFEVIDPHGRREIVRLGVSLMKNLAGSSQFGIQGHYGEDFW